MGPTDQKKVLHIIKKTRFETNSTVDKTVQTFIKKDLLALFYERSHSIHVLLLTSILGLKTDEE